MAAPWLNPYCTNMMAPNFHLIMACAPVHLLLNLQSILSLFQTFAFCSFPQFQEAMANALSTRPKTSLFDLLCHVGRRCRFVAGAFVIVSFFIITVLLMKPVRNVVHPQTTGAIPLTQATLPLDILSHCSFKHLRSRTESTQHHGLQTALSHPSDTQ